MLNRRDFLKRSPVFAAVVMTPAVWIATTPSVDDARKYNTVRAGEPLGVGVERVFVNGQEIACSAFNVQEGWAEGWKTRGTIPNDMQRFFGRITYKLQERPNG